MDSTTSPHRASSDDERDELDRINARDVIDGLDHVAGAIGGARVAGSSLFLIERRSPPRATVEIPPDRPGKNPKRAGQDQEGSDHDE